MLAITSWTSLLCLYASLAQSFVTPTFLPQSWSLLSSPSSPSLGNVKSSRGPNKPIGSYRSSYGGNKSSYGGNYQISGTTVKCNPSDVAMYLQDSGYPPDTHLKPLTAGFCNDVFSFHPPSHPSRLVIKVFSTMAHIRSTGDVEGLGTVDRTASEMGIGPEVVVSHRNFTITKFVNGRTLEEGDVHVGPGSTLLCRKLGRLVGTFHTISGSGNRLLRSLEIMADGIGGDRGEMWRREIEGVKEIMGGFRDGVMCHGDLKPSNVMLEEGNEDTEGGEGGRVKLIDFELSGGGWRGFDIYKLFRTGEKTERTEGNLRAFLEEYARVGGGGEVVEDLMSEALLFEPLTWLEAGIFFEFAMVTGGGTEEERMEWEELGKDRVGRYWESKEGWKERIEEWRKTSK